MRRTLIALSVLLLAALAMPTEAANPYAPALTVNDGVITYYDVEQRMLLLDALGASGDLRELAVNGLTEDRVKKQAAGNLGIELSEGAIEAGLAEFAAQRGLQLEDVDRVLEARGIDQQTMDDFVEAGLLWREVVATRFRARAMPSEADLDAALELSAKATVEMVTLGEIAMPFAELGQAETEALADDLYLRLRRGESFSELARRYGRSSSAATGGTLAPLPANELPPAFRTQVLLLQPGQITRPIPIAGGVAIVKLVSLNRVRPEVPPDPDDLETRDALRQQLFAERITSFGQGYLQELLGDALIVER